MSADKNANAPELSEASAEPRKRVKEDEAMLGKIPLRFNILARYKRARASVLTLPHGDVRTPVYMPVGTKATLKGITSEELANIGYRLCLSNTYHLASIPGADLMAEYGGLHKFMNWPYNLLTDSGGFQMVSLSQLCEITEEGVEFENPYDKRKMFMRPEDSIHIQNAIGADIVMALDDVVKTTTVGPRVEEACDRTIRWIDRCLVAHRRKEEQNVFPIVQGAVDLKLRERCLSALIQREANGFAIGGLAGGESKDDFWKVVAFCTERLPEEKPRYLMGVGYPVDLVVCACLGVDMFDCVFPTRTARFGVALTRYGEVKIKNSEQRDDFRPLQEGCQCPTCKKFTRTYLNSIMTKAGVSCHLLTLHNLHYLFNLMLGIHNSIIDGTLEDYVNRFLEDYFSQEKSIPKWVLDALEKAEINVKVYKNEEQKNGSTTA
eukprot:TRINITY_DN4130_c0_g1_i1.p1 TRINITY_DN4130_c0_g1~~TRINITY_DN4130_c0_g1_i1.p1  ORF type:complete len:435 (-),score=64.51 TRINITY_DN4130_c0_g1_i1:101-1405(-)